MTRSAFGDALLEADAGLYLDLEVTPGAARGRFPDGYNPWRRRIGMRVAAAPEGGAANRAVVTAIAMFFGVPAHDVALVGGATSREKRVFVAGLTRAAALDRLGVGG